MFSLAAAIDTCRSANRLLGRDFYGWTTVSADGEAVIASNGLPLKIDYSVADLPPVDILFVCVGADDRVSRQEQGAGGAAHWGRRGGALGALSVGSYLLAEAGQLDGYRCTIHWENRAGFMEKFPDIDCTGNVFEIDRKRYTCAGGTTSIDLMLEIVRARLRRRTSPTRSPTSSSTSASARPATASASGPSATSPASRKSSSASSN